VARSLEDRWEAYWSALADAEDALARTQAAVAPLPSRADVEALMADVTVLPEPDLAKCRIGIRWHSGATDEVVVARRLAVVEYRRTEPVKCVSDSHVPSLASVAVVSPASGACGSPLRVVDISRSLAAYVMGA
jgi:hypothetical protein